MNPTPVPFRLSMKALMLAPLPAPMAFSLVLVQSLGVNMPVVFFFTCLSFGYLLGITGTAALAICLLVLGRRRPVSLSLSTAIGVALGGGAYLSFLFIGWQSSGTDSGPPEDPFSDYFLRNWNDPYGWMFVTCGLSAAVLFHLLTLHFLEAKPAIEPPAPGGV